MRHDPTAEGRRWLDQARSDLRDGRILAEAGSHPSACFFAQQAAEKALKAVLLALGEEPWGHSVSELLQAVAERAEVPESLARGGHLDLYYIATRYPNGLPQGGRPENVFGTRESEEALALAQEVVEFAQGCIGGADER
ncbi:MAG: HEPN domain-containing protein [Armatimonadota bacterium]|nr:HEPN domain-containing protein [Armatimonadota bacterium]